MITISNDFAVLANHHPTYGGKTPKGITLLHWSWSSILTKCRLLTDGGEIEDRDHRWVIEHLVRFLSHPSTGVTRFDRMPISWKVITEAISAGAGVRKGSEAALEVAAAWIQETRDLGLQLTELLHQPVPVKLNRAERDDPTVFINRVLDGLCNDQGLEIEYLIPDGVSSLKVWADLRGKTLTSSMTIGAAQDRKTAKARVNWLLRQLAKTRDDGIHIKAAYGRREDIQAALAKVREDPAVLSQGRSEDLPEAVRGQADQRSGAKDGGTQDHRASARDARPGVLHPSGPVPAAMGAERAKGRGTAGEGDEARWRV